MNAPPTARWIAAGLAALAGLVVFRGAIAYDFSQDDFAALARAAGLLPQLGEPWRWLSLQAFFEAMRPIAGADPLPYHAASLAGHALASGLLVLLLSRAVGPAAALVGGVFFASHFANFTAVYWVSTIGDLWALVFGLAALLAGLREGRARWLAPPFFALSLLCKESLLLLPVALGALRVLPPASDRERRKGAPGRSAWRDPPLLVMGAIALAYLVYFLIDNAATATGTNEPYGIRVGAHLGANLLTYMGWTANAWLGTVRGFSDAVDPPVFGWGAGFAAVVLAGALVPGLRRRGWLAAIALYLLFLLPVLPLLHHTYHYYLYGSLAGAAWMVAALFDLAFGARTPAARSPASEPRRSGAARRPPPPMRGAESLERMLGWSLAALVAGALTWNGAALVRKIETMPFRHPELRADPIVDRARIAARVREALADAGPLPRGSRVVFWSPEARALAAADPDTARARAEGYWERNVRTALYDGVAVRVFDPNVRDVRFALAFDGGDASTWWAVYDVIGRTQIYPSATLDSLLAAPTGP